MPKLKKIGKIVWARTIFITVCSTLDPWLATSRQVPHRLLAPLPKARSLHSLGNTPPPHAPLLSTEKCANTLFSSFHWWQEILATFCIHATCHTKKKDLTPAKKLFFEDGSDVEKMGMVCGRALYEQDDHGAKGPTRRQAHPGCFPL